MLLQHLTLEVIRLLGDVCVDRPVSGDARQHVIDGWTARTEDKQDAFHRSTLPHEDPAAVSWIESHVLVVPVRRCSRVHHILDVLAGGQRSPEKLLTNSASLIGWMDGQVGDETVECKVRQRASKPDKR